MPTLRGPGAGPRARRVGGGVPATVPAPRAAPRPPLPPPAAPPSRPLRQVPDERAEEPSGVLLAVRIGLSRGREEVWGCGGLGLGGVGGEAKIEVLRSLCTPVHAAGGRAQQDLLAAFAVLGGGQVGS